MSCLPISPKRVCSLQTRDARSPASHISYRRHGVSRLPISPMRVCSLRTRDARIPASHIRVPEAWRVPPAHLQCGCVPTDHCCGVTHVRFIACASTVVALRQSGGGCLAGRRSQCAMYLLPLRSLCRCSRRQSARRDPAVPCVLCSAHTRVSASPARTSRCRVWPLHRVHGLASRAVNKET